MSECYQRFVRALEENGCREGRQFRCPAHDDRKPSLGLSEGDDGRVLIKCHAGCSTESIVAGLGLEMADLFEPNGGGGPAKGAVVTQRYDYTDEAGRPLARKVRLDPKGFYWQCPDVNGGWVNGRKGVRLVPYRLPAICGSDDPIFLVEGERDADRLAAEGVLATSLPDGSNPRQVPRFAEFFRGRQVILLPDNDEPGRRFMAAVAEGLRGVAEYTITVTLPGLAPGGDVSDWLDQGFNLWELTHLVSLFPKDAGPPAAPAPLTYLDLEAYADGRIPEVPWIVQGWLAESDMGLLVGGPCVGKSTTAGHLAHALARCEEWCGIQPARPCRVLVIDEEHAELTAARLYLRLGDPHSNLRLAVQQGICLRDEAGLARLRWALDDFRPELVIADSVQRLFEGVDENCATAVGEVFGRLAGLRNDFRCAFLLIHHKRKETPHGSAALEKVRGSTVFTAQADTIWSARQDRQGRMVLQQIKRRQAEMQSLVTEYTEDADGRISISAVGSVDEATDAVLQTEDRIVEFLAGQPHTEARRKDIEAAADAPRTVVHRAIKVLIADGTVSNPRRGIYRLEGEEVCSKGLEQ